MCIAVDSDSSETQEVLSQYEVDRDYREWEFMIK